MSQPDTTHHKEIQTHSASNSICESLSTTSVSICRWGQAGRKVHHPVTKWKDYFASLTSEHLTTVYIKKLCAASLVSSILQMISASRLSVRRTICAQNCAIFHLYSRWLGKGNKVTSNVSHVVFHSIRQTLAHTNDIEINWCNDKNSCLATARGENPPLQFQALHLAWHVMWSQWTQRKTNPFFLLFYIQV